MKTHTFKCNSRAPRARMALDEYLDANPNGVPLYGGRSANKVYYGMYKIYETKTQVVIEKIGG